MTPDVESFPPPLTPEQAAELRRRRRGRSIAMFVALLALAALFYAITIAKLRHGDTPFHASLDRGFASVMMRPPVPNAG